MASTLSMPAASAFISTGLALLLAPAQTANLALGFMGFEAGIIGGSFAALVHSCIGNVAAGSPFAILQSAGAGGHGMTTVSNVFGLAGLGMTVVGAVGMVGGFASRLGSLLW
ncbi:hypothetical protein NCS56_00613400 [Fusarium sp. Ph1]|nr:hypothetical protein NCS56_00613400 [Fusarium sp. Ph1]